MLSFVGLLCLPLDLWSLKCQKYFLYFPLMTATVQSQVGQNIYVYLKDLIKLSYKILCIIGSEQDVNSWKNRALVFFADSAVFYIFMPSVSHER